MMKFSLFYWEHMINVINLNKVLDKFINSLIVGKTRKNYIISR